MMLLIKIGGSLIASKHTNEFDTTYLEGISSFIIHQEEEIYITHGTGNVGHGFVKRFGMTQETYPALRRELDNYFTKIDTRFPGFERINAKNILEDTYKPTNHIICGGDATLDARILSSDDVFSHRLQNQNIKEAYMLTDVDGVLDKNGNIIPLITKENIANIEFWSKTGDVTGSMQSKIKKLFYSANNKGKVVRIINGRNLENFKNLLNNHTGIGTKICL